MGGPILLFPIFVLLVSCEPCDYFKPYIGKVPTCTPTADDYVGETNPHATPFGGMDVTNAGCRYIYSDKCCGVYPRWNWILGGCETDMVPASPTSGLACTADVQNSSSYDLYYIASYQWSGKSWILDTTSSIFGNAPGVLINSLPQFQSLKIDGTGSPHPAGGDWQAKWAPRQASTDTVGLGPPGFMFVLSAKRLQWMTFYALTQKDINRGPEGQFAPPGFSNCWYAELDFLEAPFWSSGEGRQCLIPDHPHASFFSTGAQYGGCFPMGSNLGDQFASECYTKWCCEGTRCNVGKPFINIENYGKEVAGCISSDVPPQGCTWCGLIGQPEKCLQFRVLGGCDSSSFFENDPNTEYMFAFIIDAIGTYAYRWVSTSEFQANTFWPGLKKYSAASELTSYTRPATHPQKTSSPCFSDDPSCVMFHPGSSGQRPCVSAAGDMDLLDHMGVAAADGANWWDLFQDTGQWWNYTSDIAPTLYQ